MRTILLLSLILPLMSSGCIVGKKKYEAALAREAQLQTQVKMLESARSKAEMDLSALQAELDAAKGRERALEGQLAATKAQLEDIEKQLQDERGEKATLLRDKVSLKASIDEMTAALDELARRKAEADRRMAEFKDLLARFKSLIDAGKLQVKIVDGRMVVQLATDVLFASGQASLSAEGRTAVREVADVLKAIPDRQFQVEGHTDNVPIKTERFPSNWELASARALTVVREMLDVGMPPERVSAASYGEHDPVAPNRTDEGKSQNRRIQIVVIPDLSGLPGYDELSRAGR
jgi:chemotaxis protein MotB